MKILNKIKEQSGSVTLFVLITCLFIITILLLINVGMIDKNTSQEREIIQINKNYSVNETDLANSYAKIANENGYPNYLEVQKMIEDAVQKARKEEREKTDQQIEQVRNTAEKSIEIAKTEAKLELFPIGSIYLSTTATNPSSYIGGTWEKYGQGRTLIGEGTGVDSESLEKTFENGTTGGQYNHLLTTSELPSHNHTVLPVGTIQSTFVGKAVNTSAAGSHAHNFSNGGTALVIAGTTSNSTMLDAEGFSNSVGGWFQKARKDISTIAAEGNHSHSITPTGSVTSRFTGTQTTTSSTGSGSAINKLQPYIVTYMWKRIS